MHSPNCPDHGRLVLDLAMGRLDDVAAHEAESASQSCPVCRAWWLERFEGEAAAVVDEAVAATFSHLQLPARRRGYGWMAAAAAVVMTFGVGTIWMSKSTNPKEETPAQRTASIRTISFEPSDTAGEFALIEAPDPEPAPVVRSGVQEPSVEEIVIAEATPAEVAVDRRADPLFAGGFESGDLGAWVPKT